jgi:hypothetical protein
MKQFEQAIHLDLVMRVTINVELPELLYSRTDVQTVAVSD